MKLIFPPIMLCSCETKFCPWGLNIIEPVSRITSRSWLDQNSNMIFGGFFQDLNEILKESNSNYPNIDIQSYSILK